MVEDERAEQLDRVRVELGLPAGEGGAEVEVARAGGDPLLVGALALASAGLLLGVVVGQALASRARPFSLLSAAAWQIDWTSRSASHSGSVT